MKKVAICLITLSSCYNFSTDLPTKGFSSLEAHDMDTKLRKDEPNWHLFYEFTGKLPTDLKNSFDFDAIFQNRDLKEVFNLSKGYNIISPRFIKEITLNGDIKQITPYLQNRIKELKDLNSKLGMLDQQPNSPGIEDSLVKRVVQSIIWYYTWVLRLLEHPDKSLISQINTPEGRETEKHELTGILVSLIFDNPAKFGVKREQAPIESNIAKTTADLMKKRLSILESLIQQSTANQPVNEIQEPEALPVQDVSVVQASDIVTQSAD